MPLRSLRVSNNGSDSAAVLQTMGLFAFLFFSFLFLVFAFLLGPREDFQCQCTQVVLYSIPKVNSSQSSQIMKIDSAMDMTQVHVLKDL